MPSTTNFSWTTPADTDLVKDGALAIRTLGNGIDTSLVDLKGGATGDSLVKASATDLDYNWTRLADQVLANPVINGGMDCWQRGTSISLAASSPNYTADRWFLNLGANQASTVSRQTTGDTTNLPNISYCVRVQRNSGQTGTNAMNFDQYLETANSIPFVGKTVTLSFYSRKGANYSPSSSALVCQLVTGTGIDQNIGTASGVAVAGSTTATLTANWQRFSFSVNIATSVTQLFVRFASTPTGTAGANDYYEITGVQIDVGTFTAANAPTFRRAGTTIQGELAACQRYYFRNTAGTAYGPFGVGQTSSTTAAAIAVNHPVVMRAAPTSIDFGNVQVSIPGGSGAVSALTLNQYNERMSTLSATSTGLTANLPAILRGDNNTAGYVGLNAEL